MSSLKSRTLSFQQLVLEADPDWQREYTRPWIYQFSNGRKFYAPNPLYGPFPPPPRPITGAFLLTEAGALILTEDGVGIGYDSGVESSVGLLGEFILDISQVD